MTDDRVDFSSANNDVLIIEGMADGNTAQNILLLGLEPIADNAS